MGGHVNIALGAARISFDGHGPRPVGAVQNPVWMHFSGSTASLEDKMSPFRGWLWIFPVFLPNRRCCRMRRDNPRHLVVADASPVHAPGNESAHQNCGQPEVLALLLADCCRRGSRMPLWLSASASPRC